jgi:glutamine synthetase
MTAANVLKFMKEKEVEFVDLRFTDPRGKLQHLTMDHTIVDEEMLNEGVFLMVHLLLVGRQLTSLT